MATLFSIAKVVASRIVPILLSTISEGLDFDGPDRVDDALYNQILWSMMKG
jgi:hypothetical protein